MRIHFLSPSLCFHVDNSVSEICAYRLLTFLIYLFFFIFQNVLSRSIQHHTTLWSQITVQPLSTEMYNRIIFHSTCWTLAKNTYTHWKNWLLHFNENTEPKTSNKTLNSKLHSPMTSSNFTENDNFEFLTSLNAQNSLLQWKLLIFRFNENSWRITSTQTLHS